MSNENFPPAMGPEDVEARMGTGYPGDLARICQGRIKQKLGDALGLSQFGVNLVTLEPGAGSAHRHWHETEDEFIYVLEGTATLVTDAGEQELKAGMFAGYPAGRADGHHLVNKSEGLVRYLEVGTRALNDLAHFPDVDLMAVKEGGAFRFVKKDGGDFSEG